MNQIELLWQLQNLDSEIMELERKLNAAEIKERLKEIKLKFDAEKEKLDSNKELVDRGKKEIRASKTKKEELRFSFQKTEEKLYSGIVSSAKQMEAMQKNLDETQNTIQKLEDKMSQLKQEVEDLEEEEKKGKLKLLRLKNTFDSLKKEYTENRQEAAKKYEALKEKRQELVKTINKNLLRSYNRVKTGTDTAVVLVEDGKCSGCHMEVSVLCMQHLKEGSIVSCETCGRILYQRES